MPDWSTTQYKEKKNHTQQLNTSVSTADVKKIIIIYYHLFTIIIFDRSDVVDEPTVYYIYQQCYTGIQCKYSPLSSLFSALFLFSIQCYLDHVTSSHVLLKTPGVIFNMSQWRPVSGNILVCPFFIIQDFCLSLQPRLFFFYLMKCV